MSHPQHPTCPACSKALFKSPAAAKVKPADPYAYCRNPVCSEYTFRNDKPADPKKPSADQLLKAVKVSDKGEVLKRNQEVPRKGSRAAGMSVAAAKAAVKRAPKAPPKPTPKAKAVEAVLKAVEPAPATPAPEPPKPLPVSKRGVARRAAPAEEVQAAKAAKPKESEPLAKARIRIREILALVTDGQPKESISLTLAILNQETGNQKAAEVLIDEFELDKKYGLLKFT